MRIRWNLIVGGLIALIVILFVFSLINAQLFAIMLIAAIVGLIARDDDGDEHSSNQPHAGSPEGSQSLSFPPQS